MRDVEVILNCPLHGAFATLEEHDDLVSTDPVHTTHTDTAYILHLASKPIPMIFFLSIS